MREIEFRAWLKYEEKMIDVKAIDWDEEGKIFSVNYPEGKFYNGYDIDCIELLEYTGLKDKNGVKIFDGDIVKFDEDNICFIEWDEYDYSYRIKNKEIDDILCGFRPKDFEVIGNIYENKELLK